MLSSYDLFSGIGGMALGLRSVARPILFCELSSDCQSVLQTNMKAGRLCQAPIHPDILTLQAHHRVDLITAGFPCQDISCGSSTASGIGGTRSGLVNEALRVARRTSARFLFLENSPYILSRGLDELVRKLRKSGYIDVRWCILSAAHVGAPHMRKRWFCVARTPGSRYECARQANLPQVSWKGEPVPRTVTKTSDQATKARTRRCQMLGNAVVPQCVACAWNALTRTPATGYKLVQEPPSSFVRLSVAGFQRDRWATPTATRCDVYINVGARASQNIFNQILHDKGTLARFGQRDGGELRKVREVNPNFIEWLMGFPQNWTK